jgi:pimeloyl-ACP methyl ester carboxylesterase
MARKRGQQLSVQSADGTAIGYTLSGAGPSLLLVHGSAVDRRSCYLLDSVLSESRRVALMDRRGRGLSSDGPVYGLAREADDVLAVLGALEPPVHLVGLSFGCLPVLEAATRSDRLSGVTLYEPPIRTPAYPFLQPERMDELERMIAEGRRAEAARVVLLEAISATDSEMREIDAVPGAWAAAEALLSVTAREFRVILSYEPKAEGAAGITVPVTVLIGGESSPQFKAGAERLAASHPGMRLRVVPGLSHLAPLIAPAPLAAAILEAGPPEVPKPG